MKHLQNYYMAANKQDIIFVHQSDNVHVPLHNERFDLDTFQ